MFKKLTTTAFAAVALFTGVVLMTTVAASGANTAKPTKPVNTALPTINGTAQQGQTLTAGTGNWSGSPTSYAYQWRRCKSNGTGCADISSATAATYNAVAADVGSTLRIVVTATNSAGSTAATSNQTATVAGAVSPPQNTALPTIGGVAQQGRTLTASDGNWSGSPTSYAYQWSRCNVNGKGCTNIALANSQTYLLAAGDIGFTIRAVVTAINNGGSTAATSNQTSLVTAAPVTPPTNTGPPTIGGVAQEGQTLTASDGSWSGSTATYTYKWQSCNSGSCADIAGATSSTYVLTATEIGSTIDVVVTATNTAGTASATSDPTATVTATVVAPTNTGPPTIGGVAQEGQTLTASDGSWSGSTATYTYKWQSCNSGSCADIAGATSSTYVLTATEIGSTIDVVVTATNTAGTASATSDPTATVTATVVAPTNTGPPTIGGVAQEGQTLTASDGSWSGSTATYTYKWQSCNSGSCADIAGATSSTYVLTATEIGSTIDVVVTATNTAGTASATSDPTATVQAGLRPINNDCSAGTVAFTFDDGPDVYTAGMMAKLMALNLHATFFVLGQKAQASPQIIAAEVANGFSVQNHTWDHASFTGASTGTAPLTDAQIQAELDSASDAIVAAGAPRPTMYRPPYGDINSYDDLLARNLGYRIVMPWGTPGGNIVDSRDWTGISPAQIASNVVVGYSLNGFFYPGIKADSVVAMHDGDQTAASTLQSLQTIVDYMNAHHLCSAGSIRSDATGGVVPAPAPPEPTSGNLVQNASLETLPANPNPASEPVCFQQAGANIASNVASWSLTSDAHSGSVAERVDVTAWSAGDRKLVLTQRQSQASCLAVVTPGNTYSMWVWYKGSWAYSGSNPTKVSIVTYYRNSAGTWVTWQASPLLAPTASWNLANFTSAPLPAGATAVSFGLAISGVGNVTTDDYAMVMNN